MDRLPARSRLLDIEGAAEYLGTSPRFVRRVVAERRVRFYKVGRHVRLSEADLAAFVMQGAVEPQI